MTSALDWDARIPERHPAFKVLQEVWTFSRYVDWPRVDALQLSLQGRAEPPRNTSGAELRLVTSAGGTARAYEESVHERGELHVCPDSWHDLFNVLTWMTYPRAKAALNARHVHELAVPTQARTRVRDALTTFDEDGLIIVSADRELLALIREFQWRELFLTRRDQWHTALHVLPFGHALLEKLLDPFVGLTAKAVLIEVEENFFQLSSDERAKDLDQRLSELIRARDGFVTPQWLSPVPVLGIPGWWPDIESEIFYNNPQYFRSGRRARAAASTVSK